MIVIRENEQYKTELPHADYLNTYVYLMDYLII